MTAEEWEKKWGSLPQEPFEDKDAEIERLKALIVNRLKATYADVDEMQKVFDIVVNTLALREAEIEQLKALLGRAADALGAAQISREIMDANGITEELIAELRKAAK